MATAATKLMTAEEFLDFCYRPENQARDFELVRGEVVEMTKAGQRHGFVCSNVVWVLSNYVRPRGKGYVCSNDTGVLIERDPDTVRGPDVLLYDDAESYEQIPVKYGDKPPVLAVEVLSPHDPHGELMERIADQIRCGTKLVWVIDPETRMVTVHRPGKEHYVVRHDQELTGDDVLPDFRCKVAEFFTMPGK